MKPKKQVPRRLLLVALGTLLIGGLGSAIFITIWGYEQARLEPQLAWMLAPSIAILAITTLALACVLILAIERVYRSLKGSVINATTVRRLTWMGIASLVATLGCVSGFALMLHGTKPIGGPGPSFLWVAGLTFFLFAMTMGIFFVRHVIAEGVSYREENELTV